LAEKITWKFFVRCVLAVTLASGLAGVCLLVFQNVGMISSLPRSVVLINFALTLACVVGLRLLSGVIFRGEGVSEKSPLFTRGFWFRTLPGVFGYFFPIGILLGTYMTWSYLYVGTPMPISGQIKHWWGELVDLVYGRLQGDLTSVFGISGHSTWDLAFSPWRFLENSTVSFFQPGAALIMGRTLSAILFLLVAVVLFLQRKWVFMAATKLGLFPIFLGLYSQILYYTSTGYIHIRVWYWVGEMLFSIIFLGVFLECVYQLFNRVKIKPLVWKAAMVSASLIVLVTFTRMVVNRFPYSVLPGQQTNYLTEINALEASTESGAIIGQTGGGTTAYFITDRIIVNLDGLINGPEYFHLLRTGQGAAYLDRIGLDYVFGDEHMLTASSPYSSLLEGHLEWLSKIGETTLFRYLPTPPGN
jgi:hypothetical protein